MAKVTAAVIVIIAVVSYSSYLIDFSIFKDVLEIGEGDLPSTGRLIINFAIGVLVAALITLIVSYLSASKRQYLFYSDKLEIHNNFLIFNISKKEIDLSKIVSVNVEFKGEKKLFGLGKIILMLTGTKEKSVDLEDLDQPDYYVPYIQRLLDAIKMQETKQFVLNNKIDNTLSGL